MEPTDADKSKAKDILRASIEQDNPLRLIDDIAHALAAEREAKRVLANVVNIAVELHKAIDTGIKGMNENWSQSDLNKAEVETYRMMGKLGEAVCDMSNPLARAALAEAAKATTRENNP